MKKQNKYLIVIAALVLINTIVIAFFLFFPPHPHRPHHSEDKLEEVVRMLHLNEDQEKKFRDLAHEHHEEIMSLEESQQTILLPYFKKLSDSSAEVKENKVLDQFSALEKQKVMVTYKHFEEIKSILVEGQMSYYKSFTDRFIRDVLLNQKKTSPPPKD